MNQNLKCEQIDVQFSFHITQRNISAGHCLVYNDKQRVGQSIPEAHSEVVFFCMWKKFFSSVWKKFFSPVCPAANVSAK